MDAKMTPENFGTPAPGGADFTALRHPHGPRPGAAQIEDVQREVEQIAREHGLDCFPQVFELINYQQLCVIAARGGFPTRYPHWRFGMEYEQLSRSHEYGLQKIFEMVINNNPSFAFLLDSNSPAMQRCVMAHVYAHNDFMKNNQYFVHTNRTMLDEMANHAVRIRSCGDRYGRETVERFIDTCLSVEDLIDPHDAAIKRRTDRPPMRHGTAANEDQEAEELKAWRVPGGGYMDRFLNPPEQLKAEEERLRSARLAREGRFPAQPERDVLLFLLEHAPLKDWQRDVLAIIRDEACYFAPQAATKIMNEGWASYWHSHIMTRHLLPKYQGELHEYADQNSKVLASPGGGLNPYKLGVELFRDIEERWNTGRFGRDYTECEDRARKEHWDRKLGLGRQKIFEVRQIHSDLTFIDAFLTPEFCTRQKLFMFQRVAENESAQIQSREFQRIKQTLLDNLINAGRPIIRLIDANYGNRAALCLQHEHCGRDLRLDYAEKTLENLYRLWTRPVHIETVLEGKMVVLGFDGHKHSRREIA